MDFFDFLKNNKLIILVISIILNICLVSTTVYFYYISNNKEENKTEIAKDIIKEEKPNTADTFYVEIKGAIKNPGVYEASNKNIVNDIVLLAGGFTKNAYTKNINLSRKVSSELVIYVYTNNEYKKENTIIIKEPCECSSYDIRNCTENKASEIIASDKDTAFENPNINNSNSGDGINKKVNINTATKEELTTLTGIGDSKADDIISYRMTNGNFKNIEDIKNVSGIGDALFAKIKDNITV